MDTESFIRAGGGGGEAFYTPRTPHGGSGGGGRGARGGGGGGGGERSVSPLDLSQGAAGSSKHTCMRRVLCVSFVCASRSLERAMISNRSQIGLELIEMAGKRDAKLQLLLHP